jgi:hypothetical protein
MSESGEDISKNVGSTSINHDRAGQLNISRTALNAAQEGTEFGTPTSFHCKNEEVEVAFREYLRMRPSPSHRYGNFNLLAKLGKCINMLGGLC